MNTTFKQEDLNVIPEDPIWFLREIARRDGNLRLCSFVIPEYKGVPTGWIYSEPELGFWHRFYSDDEEGETSNIAIIEKVDGHVVELPSKYIKFINDDDLREETEKGGDSVA